MGNFPFVANPAIADLTTPTADTTPQQDPSAVAASLAPDFSQVGGNPVSGDSYAPTPTDVYPSTPIASPAQTQDTGLPPGFKSTPPGWRPGMDVPEGSDFSTLPPGFKSTPPGWRPGMPFPEAQVPQAAPAIAPKPPAKPTNYGNDFAGSILKAESSIKLPFDPEGHATQSFIHGFQENLLPSAAAGGIALSTGALVSAALAGGEAGAAAGLFAGGVGAAPGFIVGALIGLGAAIGGYALASWAQSEMSKNLIPEQTMTSYTEQKGYEQRYYGDQFALGGILPQALAFRFNPGGLLQAGRLVGKLTVLPKAQKLPALMTEEGKAGFNQLLFVVYGGSNTAIQAKAEFDAYAKDPINTPPPQLTATAINLFGSMLFSGRPRWQGVLSHEQLRLANEAVQKVGQEHSNGVLDAVADVPAAKNDIELMHQLDRQFLDNPTGPEAPKIQQQMLGVAARIEAAAATPVDPESGTPITPAQPVNFDRFNQAVRGETPPIEPAPLAPFEEFNRVVRGNKQQVSVGENFQGQQRVAGPPPGEGAWWRHGGNVWARFPPVEAVDPALVAESKKLAEQVASGQMSPEQADQYAHENGLPDWYTPADGMTHPFQPAGEPLRINDQFTRGATNVTRSEEDPNLQQGVGQAAQDLGLERGPMAANGLDPAKFKAAAERMGQPPVELSLQEREAQAGVPPEEMTHVQQVIADMRRINREEGVGQTIDQPSQLYGETGFTNTRGETNGIQQETTGIGQGTDQTNGIGQARVPDQASTTGKVGDEAPATGVPGEGGIASTPGQEAGPQTGPEPNAPVAGIRNGSFGGRTSTLRPPDIGTGNIPTSVVGKPGSAGEAAGSTAANGNAAIGPDFSPESFAARYREATERGSTATQNEAQAGSAGVGTDAPVKSSSDDPNFQEKVLQASLDLGVNPDDVPGVIGSLRSRLEEWKAFFGFRRGEKVDKSLLFIPDDPKIRPAVPENAAHWPAINATDSLVDMIRADPKGNPDLKYVMREIPDDATLVALMGKGKANKDFFPNGQRAINGLQHSSPQARQRVIATNVVFGDGTSVLTEARATIIHNSRVESGAYDNQKTGVLNDPIIRRALVGLGLIREYTPNGVSEANLARADMGLMPDTRKLSDYGGAKMGEARGPADKWILRAFLGIDKPPTDRPDDPHYLYAFGRMNHLARLLMADNPGMTPAEVQSRIWGGMHVVYSERIAAIKAAARMTGNPEIIKMANRLRGNLLARDLGEIFRDNYELHPGSKLPILEWDKILAKHQTILMDLAQKFVTSRYLKGQLGGVTAEGKAFDVKDIQVQENELAQQLRNRPKLTQELSDFYEKFVLNAPNGRGPAQMRFSLQTAFGDSAEKIMELAYTMKHSNRTALTGQARILWDLAMEPDAAELRDVPSQAELDREMPAIVDEAHDILGLPRGIFGVRFFSSRKSGYIAYYNNHEPNQVSIERTSFNFANLGRKIIARGLAASIDGPVTKDMDPYSKKQVVKFVAELEAGDQRTIALRILGEEATHLLQERIIPGITEFSEASPDHVLVPVASKMLDFMVDKIGAKYLLGAPEAGWGNELESLIYHVTKDRTGTPSSLNEMLGGVKGAKAQGQIMPLGQALNIILEHQAAQYGAYKNVPHSRFGLYSDEIFRRQVHDAKFHEEQFKILGKAYDKEKALLADSLAVEADTQRGGRGPNPAIDSGVPSTEESTAGIDSYAKLTPDAATSGDPTSGWPDTSAPNQESVGKEVAYTERLGNLKSGAEMLKAAKGDQRVIDVLEGHAKLLERIVSNAEPKFGSNVDIRLQRLTRDAVNNVERKPMEAPDSYARRVVKASGIYEDVEHAVQVLKASRDGLWAVENKIGKPEMKLGDKKYQGTPDQHVTSWDSKFRDVIAEATDRIPPEHYAAEPIDVSPVGLDPVVLRAAFDEGWNPVRSTAREGAVSDVNKRGQRMGIRAPEESKPIVTRDKEFSYNGTYHVQVGDETYQMFRDPDSRMWHEGGTNRHYSQTFLGYTKEEALKALLEKHDQAPAMSVNDFRQGIKFEPTKRLDPVTAANQVEAGHEAFEGAQDFHEGIKDAGIFDPAEVPKIAKKGSEILAEEPVPPPIPEPSVNSGDAPGVAPHMAQTPSEKAEAKKQALITISRQEMRDYNSKALIPGLGAENPLQRSAHRVMADIVSLLYKSFDITGYYQHPENYVMDKVHGTTLFNAKYKELGPILDKVMDSLPEGANDRISATLYADEAARKGLLDGLSADEQLIANHLYHYFRVTRDVLTRAGVIDTAEENYIPLRFRAEKGNKPQRAYTDSSFTPHSIERVKNDVGESLFKSPRELQNYANSNDAPPGIKGRTVEQNLGALIEGHGISISKSLMMHHMVNRLKEVEAQVGKTPEEQARVMVPRDGKYFKTNEIASKYEGDYREVKYGPWKTPTRNLLVHKSLAETMEREGRFTDLGDAPPIRLARFLATTASWFKQYKFNSPVHAYSMLGNISTHTGMFGVHEVLHRGGEIVDGPDSKVRDRLIGNGLTAERIHSPEDMGGPSDFLQSKYLGPVGAYFRGFHKVVWGKIGYRGMFGLSEFLSNQNLAKWQGDHPGETPSPELLTSFDKQAILGAKKALGYLDNMDMTQNYNLFGNVAFLANRWTTGQLRTMGEAFGIKSLARLGNPIQIEGPTPADTAFLQRRAIAQSQRLVMGGMIRLAMTSLVMSSGVSALFNNGVPTTPFENFQKDPNHTFDIYTGRDQATGRDTWIKTPFYLFQREMLDWAMAAVKAQTEGKDLVNVNKLGDSVVAAPFMRFFGKMNPATKLSLESLTGNEISQWMRGFSSYDIDHDPHIVNINKSMQMLGIPDAGSLENRLIYAFRQFSPSINYPTNLDKPAADPGAVFSALGIGTFNPFTGTNAANLGLGAAGTRAEAGTQFVKASDGTMQPMWKVSNEADRKYEISQKILEIAKTMGTGTQAEEQTKLQEMDGLRQDAGYTIGQITQILLYSKSTTKGSEGLLADNAAPQGSTPKSQQPTVINGKALTPQQEVSYQSVIFQRQMYGMAQLMSDPTWAQKDMTQRGDDARVMNSFTDRITNEQFGQAIGARQGAAIPNAQANAMITEFGTIKRKAQEDLLASPMYKLADQQTQQTMMSDRISATESALWAKNFGSLKGASVPNLLRYVELQTGLRDGVRQTVQTLPSYAMATPLDQANQLKLGLAFADNLMAQATSGKGPGGFDSTLNENQMYAAVRNGIVLQDAALSTLHQSQIYASATTQAEQQGLDNKYVTLAHTVAIADMRHNVLSSPQNGFDEILHTQIAVDEGYQHLLDQYFGANGKARYDQYTTELSNLKLRFKQDYTVAPKDLSKYDSMITNWYYQQNPQYYYFLQARTNWEKYDPLGVAYKAQSAANFNYASAVSPG